MTENQDTQNPTKYSDNPSESFNFQNGMAPPLSEGKPNYR